MRSGKRVVALILLLPGLILLGNSLNWAGIRHGESVRAKSARRSMQQQLEERRQLESNLSWVRDNSGADGSRELSSVNLGDLDRASVTLGWSDLRTNATVPPPPSPGMAIGQTPHDLQALLSSGYQTARISGADIVYFVWTDWGRIPSNYGDNDRYVAYNSYAISTNTLNQGFDGEFVALTAEASAGYINLDVGTGNEASSSCHQREDPSFPYNPWHLGFPIPGNSFHDDAGLGGYGAGGCSEVLHPRNAASRDAANTGVRHVVAHSQVSGCLPHLLWYWRYNGASWTGPVIIDSTPSISYAVADDPNSSKLAIGVHVDNHASMNGLNNVAYFESATDGAGWITNAEAKTKTVVTSYSDPLGPQAWLHMSITYDNSSVLHLVFDEQRYANATKESSLRHWNSSRNTVRPVAFGYWDSPLLTGINNLNLTKPTIGIGDGGTMCQGGAQSNNNYVYVAYIQLSGQSAAEQEDASLAGYYNGELCLAVSSSGGNTWAVPVNLSNTKTPICNPGPVDTTTGLPQRPDSVCRSENWATIGRVVDDIDIFFISDLDAGAIPYGEGTWQVNPVHYLRIPGGTTDAQHVCPVIAPNFEANLTSEPECEYHASPSGSDMETLTVINLGNATLSGVISLTDFPGPPSMTLSGGAGAYSIPAGSPDIVKTVTMAANGGAEGLYIGQISITHNDVSKPSPRNFPIEFFVFNQFFCGQELLMKSGVASPGSLQLEVGSNGRFASENPIGGLWRHADSSSSVYDGSLLIAHGPQGPDTTVYLRFGGLVRVNGQYGFRAQGDMVIDTSAYGSGDGCALAVARMSIRDSVVGIEVEWVFPQDPNDDELVFARYRIYRHNPSTAVTNLAIGLLADLDVLPASRLGFVQQGTTNSPGSDGSRNLIWVRGSDTAGHVPVGDLTATRFRGGIAVAEGFEGADIGNSNEVLRAAGGPTDGFFYRELQNLAGISLYSIADTDLYALIALDKGRSIALNDTLTYNLVFVSDTLSEASMKAAVDVGLARVAQEDFGCGNCTCASCQGDPDCNGSIGILDVVSAANQIYRGTPPTFTPGCPIAQVDVNCDGCLNILDLLLMVEVAYRGATTSIFCDACLCVSSPQLCVPPPLATGTGSIVIQSKTFLPGAVGCTVGVFISNNIPLEGFQLPLELRSLTPGSYIANNFNFTRMPNSRVDLSPLGSADPGGAWPAPVTINRIYAVPSGPGCSGPLSSTWQNNAAQVDFVSPDAVLHVTVSTGDPNAGDDTDLNPGSDPSNAPSFIFAFDVNNVLGNFIIDTCCMAPCTHLLYLGPGTTPKSLNSPDQASLSVPSFTPGIITIGTPINCAARTVTNRFLVACPKGDTAFHVMLRDGAGDPIVGYSDVWLDFSACTGSELMPIAGQHPSWPIVPAPAPSDANGDIAFNVFAGGDCADCQVTVNTGCGFSATVPVHSVDVNGDLCVTEADHDDAEGLCRDYNADLVVDHDDIALHIDHIDHCGPAGPCDYLDIDVSVRPQERISPGDSVFVNWTVTNTSDADICTVDSVAIYHFDCETSASERWVASSAVGAALLPGGQIAGLIEYINPDSLDFCMQVRVYSDCCDTFAVTIIRITPERLCSPSDSCFVFYCAQLTIAGVLFDPPELLAEGWSYEVINTTIILDGTPTPVTQTTICTGPSPTEGTTGYVRIRHTGFGSPKVYSVTVKAQEGDVCGQIGDCQGTLDRRIPDCILNVQDVVCMIDYIFRGGAVPCPATNADLNCDCSPDVVDIVLEINSVFRGQPPPPACDVVCP